MALTLRHLAGTLVPWGTLALMPMASPAAGREPIRLGQSAPISGPLAKTATAFRDAANAVFGEVNAQGGIAGQRIELITLDDEDRPERTAVNVKLLASEHRVVALFGFAGSGAHRAGPRGAQEERLPYIAPVSGSTELRENAFAWNYVLRASHTDEIAYIVRHTSTVGVRRVALVFEYNSQGWELRDAMLDALAARDLTPAAVTSIDREGSAYSLPGAVSSVLAGKPDAVVLGSDYVASAKLVEALRGAGYTGLFYTLSTVGGTALMEQLGPLAPGLSVTQVVPFPWTSALPVSRAFQAFCATHKLEPSFASMEGWLAAQLLVDALRKAKDATPARIAEAIDATGPRDFGGFRAALQRGRGQRGYVDLTVYSRSGKFVR